MEKNLAFLSCFDRHEALITSSYFTSNLTNNDYTDTASNATLADDYYAFDDADDYQDNSLHEKMSMARRVIVVIICLFGIVGNSLTLVILMRKKLKKTSDVRDRNVHFGLFSLCISDFLFCVCLLPHGILDLEIFESSSMDFRLVYRAYHSALLSTLILTSTWCTVTMAALRYLALKSVVPTNPLMTQTGTKVCYLFVFLVSTAFSVPRFFEEMIDSIECPDGRKKFFISHGPLITHKTARSAYMWLYFVFGIFVPLAALAVSNVGLMKTLMNSDRTRRQMAVTQQHLKTNKRILYILITIVIMYIALVSPAEIFKFVMDRLVYTSSASMGLLIANEVTNILQNINFSCNFVVYFLLNVQFRTALKELCRPCSVRSPAPRNERYRFRPFSRQKSDVSKYIETTQTRV